MGNWYSKEIGDGVAAFGPSTTVQNAFEKLALAGQPISDVAVFSLYDRRANMVTLYFTPAAEALALAFGANPCSKPETNKRLALLVGDARSMGAHFPDHPAISKRSSP